MAKIEVLVEGTARQSHDGLWVANSSCTLIREAGRLILVDPGQDPAPLLRALKTRGIEPARINFIFLTHHHLDHIVNIRLFPKADVAMGDLLASGEKSGIISNLLPGTRIRLLPTPGHCDEHWSLITTTEDQTRVAIAGDAFWWLDGQQQLLDRNSLVNLDDPTGRDVVRLRDSRKLLLENADYIIPGHGSGFQVPRR